MTNLQKLFEERTPINPSFSSDQPSASAIPIHIVFQIIEILVCIGLAIFFGFQRYRGRCGWQVLYVSMINPFGYICSMSLPREYVFLKLENGQEFFWFRYAGWVATCPIMLELLCRIVVPRKPSTDLLMRILISDLLLILCGVTAAIQKNLALKFVFFTFSGIINLIMFYTIFRIFRLSNDKKRGIPPNQKTYRRNVMLLTFVSWTLFPILFLLGPETFGVISWEWSTVGHCVGDLISKNLYTFISWHFRNVFMKRKDNIASAAASTNGSASTLASETTRDYDNFSLSQLSGIGRFNKKAKKHQTSHKSHIPSKHRRSNSRGHDIEAPPPRTLPNQNSNQWKQQHSHHHEMQESDTDVSEWNANHASDGISGPERAGMRSEWESNLSLTQEAQNPPPTRTFKKQSSRSSYHGNERFLDDL